jgi:hypothetical protein
MPSTKQVFCRFVGSKSHRNPDQTNPVAFLSPLSNFFGKSIFMKKLPVDLGELQLALEDYDGGLGLHTHWFDKQTGNVIFSTEDLEEQDELREQIEEDAEDRFVQIEPIASHNGFRIMQNFVETMGLSRLREKLEWCLDGPKPFRRFKDALYENKAVQEKWYKFHDEASARFAIEWLAELDIEPLSGVSAGTEIDVEAVGTQTAEMEAEQHEAAELAPKSFASIRPAANERREAAPKAKEPRNRAAEAGLEFVCRDLRLHHPDGSFDDGGRFYPSEKEVRDCCADIRAPSRAFPFSLMKHCRTAKHVAKLYGISETDLKGEIEKVKQQLWYLCQTRDFDRIRCIVDSSVLTVDPFLAPYDVPPPRGILEETEKQGILKRRVWETLFAALDDYERRWQAHKT